MRESGGGEIRRCNEQFELVVVDKRAGQLAVHEEHQRVDEAAE